MARSGLSNNREYLVIPIVKLHASELYRHLAKGEVDTSTMDQEDKSAVLPYLWSDQVHKQAISSTFKISRTEVHRALTRLKTSIAERELDDTLSPRLLAVDVLELRDRIIYAALATKQPRIALDTMVKTTQLLQDIGVLEKQPERVVVEERHYEVVFDEDGTIHTHEMEQDKDGTYQLAEEDVEFIVQEDEPSD